MASDDGDTWVTSPKLFRLDDDDDYEDLLGTQFPNDNPDLPLLDLDENLLSEPVEQPVQQRQKLRQAQSPQATNEVGLTQSGRKHRRSQIPDDAEIIDLDAVKPDGTYRNSVQGPQTFVKTEKQDTAVHNNGRTPVIKTEEVEMGFSWKAMPEQCINLVDSDDEPNNDKDQSDEIEYNDNTHNDANPSAIKQESEEWTWAEMQREVIELSESEDHAASASALSNTIPPSFIAKRAPADRAKLLRAQKMYAERALGRRVIAGAGGIFKGAQPPAAPVSVPQEIENELAWMNSAIDPDEDANDATTFAQMKARYNRKKRAGRNSFEDDILFMKAESAEKARIKRLNDDYLRDLGPIYRYISQSVL